MDTIELEGTELVDEVTVDQIAPVEVPAKPKPRKATATKRATSSTVKKTKVRAKAVTSKTKPQAKDQWGLRKGSAKSKAAAMYARKSGSTLEEIKTALGSTQLNVLTGLAADGHKVKRERIERKGKRPIMRYWLTAK